ncbi:MAG TPA: TatD family hydrolase [Chloroflexota bacterium]|nr:TatD family hydrolase [Chloroflexota bacterium]
MPALIADTHAHLADSTLLDDVDAVVEQAIEVGVGRILAVATNLESSLRSIRLAQQFPIVYAAVGIHPHEADTFSPAALAKLRRLASEPKVVAIGEIGLDYYRDLVPVAVQTTAFIEQLALAAELNLPVVIHDREAHADLLRLISTTERGSALANRAGVLHCFSGNQVMASAAIDHGFFISFAGNLTYRRSSELRALAAQLPSDWILTETDSPFLAPEHRRGRRNEPANVRFVVGALARERELPVETAATQTYQNAQRLFGWS